MFGLLLSGCGTKKEEANQDNAGEAVAPANLLEEIKANGTLRVGTEGTYPPFTFHDSKGTLTGFDVDIASEIAKRLGVKAEGEKSGPIVGQ